MPSRLSASVAFVVVMGVGSLLAGCATPPGGRAMPGSAAEIDPPRVKARDDITAIYQFYSADPWLRDTDGHVFGFKVPVYFHSAATSKGAFVPGKIMVWLYAVKPRTDGNQAREFLYGWEMNEQEAMGYRSRKRVQMGNFYGFFFGWPPELDLLGRQIEIVFGYERLDGKIIMGPPRRFRVPLPAGYRRPPARSPATTQAVARPPAERD